MSVADPSTQILSAAWVAPISQPIIRDGAIVVRDGRILAVGSADSLRNQYPDAIETEHGNAVLLPGLINAHAHLDLTRLSRKTSPGSFVEWVKGVIQTSIPRTDWKWWLDSALAGCDQCVQFGVTSVGDISGRYTSQLREALAKKTGPRLTSYGEVTAMAQRRGALTERLAVAANPESGLRIGISPHAPYSIESEGYRACLQTAQRLDLPLTTHLGETLDEAEFLASHSGPFRDLWNFLGAWDEQVPAFTGGPIRYAKSLGLLDYPLTLLAHVNYCDDDELAILAKGKASIAYCPRTHRYFDHPPHRWREMLAAGINVAVGTDSRASSPDLNLLDDLRLLHQIAPDFPVEQLWEIATVRGAKAIGATDVGSLTPGHHADIVAFPINSTNPLLEVLESDVPPTAVYIAGVSAQHSRTRI